GGACPPPPPGSWPPTPTAPRPSCPTTVWPAMTWLARWPRRCGRPRRPRSSRPLPRTSTICSRRWRCGSGGLSRARCPASTVSSWRRGGYLFDTGRIEEALDARAQAVELVPAQPPTRLRARVTAAMAQALVNARRPDDARGWCDEALAAARGAGSADEEADVLITLGMIEQYHDPAKARSLFAAARAQAAGAGNLEIELRAVYDDAEVGKQLGDLASAGAAFA